MPDLAGGRVISGDREIAHQTLMGRALRAATGFAALGVEAGDAVALVLRNDFPFFEASYAAQMLGPIACRSIGMARRRRSATCCATAALR